MNDQNIFIILASVIWSIWKTRNDWFFSDVLIKSPKAIAYKILGFLSQRKKMQNSEDRMKTEEVICKLQEGLKAW